MPNDFGQLVIRRLDPLPAIALSLREIDKNRQKHESGEDGRYTAGQGDTETVPKELVEVRKKEG